MENTPVLPEHSAVGTSIVVAAPGGVPGVTSKVSAGPVPHELVPATMIMPVPVPTTVVMDEVELEPLQPVPRTVQE